MIQYTTPLYEAAIQGHTEVVQLLLQAGADPNMASNLGRTTLHAAAERYWVDILGVLLDGGAKLDRGDPLLHGDTPLHVATVNGYKNVVNVLLERAAPCHILLGVPSLTRDALRMLKKYVP